MRLKKSICFSEKSEGATIGILLKKTCNFIRKRLQYCEVFKNTRSSHQRCSIIKGVLLNFAKFTGKDLYQGVFLNKVAGLRPATSLRKRLWHRCFPLNFAKFIRTSFYRTPLVSSSRTPISKIICERLLLKISTSVANFPKAGNF